MVVVAAPQPAQRPPPVQRVRVRYAKRGRMRFASHRDIARVLERALRRAGVPMAYSSGFSPHPRVSFAGAAPTGAASEAEYLELALAERRETHDVARSLDAALPPGLDVVEVVTAGPTPLAERLTASRWEVTLPRVEAGEAGEAVRRFLAQPVVEVPRTTKQGRRVLNCREPVLALSVRENPAGSTGCAILELVVRHTTPAVRPDDVLAGLRTVAGLVPPLPARQTRLAQGPVDPDTASVGDPFDADRDAS